MAKQSKRIKAALEKVDVLKEYNLLDAVSLAKETARVKFDESVDIAVRLGVDPRKADQNVRGSVMLPKGTGKKFRVLVFAKGEKEAEAREAGAEHVGGEDLLKKIQDGWLEFDRVVATPDMMGLVGRVAKILGPRGMMPNPKTGTVTFGVKEAIEEIQAGKVDFRVDKAGTVHAPVGRVSFSSEDLAENFNALMAEVVRLKPSSSKGRYVKTVSLSSTMGVGVRVVFSVN
jgi:large subunit ribosomal protein L1